MRLNFYSFLSLLFISTAFLQAQDYLISFAGSGAATIVETVKVENLTQAYASAGWAFASRTINY